VGQVKDKWHDDWTSGGVPVLCLIERDGMWGSNL